MTTAPELTFSSIVAQAYSDGYAIHGDLNLQPEKFENHLYLVTEKHLGPNARPETRLSFLRALNTADLYLTVGCAQRSDLAWRRFVEVYRKFIHDVARFFSPNADAARELAADVLADLCMFDRSGRSRIASFDGQQSLRTWLRVLISHRAINRARLKGGTRLKL